MIIANIVKTRSIYPIVIKANSVGSSFIVTSGGVKLSINNSGQVDYEYFKVNPFSGQGTGLDEKNKLRFNIAPAINDYITDSVSPQYKDTNAVILGTNDMQSDVYTLAQLDLVGGQLPYAGIGSEEYLFCVKGYSPNSYNLVNDSDFPFISNTADDILINDFYITTYLPNQIIGNVYLIRGGYQVEYKSLVTGATQNLTLIDKLQQIPYVHEDFINEGNVLTIKDATGSTILKQLRFEPKTECKYTPVICDFISMFGVWKRIFFYKASNMSLEMTNQMMKISDLGINQNRTFGTQGNISVKVNTDWVGEEFNQDLSELMMSENILLNGVPARMKTKSTELFKNINNKTINYTLEFDLNTDLIRKSL